VECEDEDGTGCCCKAVKEQRHEVPEGLIAVRRHLDSAGRDSYELDGEPASFTQVQEALARHGLDRAAVSVIRQGELERILLADPELRAEILAQAAGMPVAAPDDEEALVLELERERLRARLGELIVETSEVAKTRGEGGIEEPAELTEQREKAALVAAVLDEWGTQERLPGGRERVFDLLVLPAADGGAPPAQSRSGLRTLLEERASEKVDQDRGTADLEARAALQQTLLDERRRLERALEQVEARLIAFTTRLTEEAAGWRSRLGESHRRVEDRFARYFAYLVPGGRAELPLDLSGGPAQAGLDVRVAFPASGFERLEALSGGQRAMVAFALGLALFMETPARLVVLDEVEPALDDSNLRRFNDLLHEVADTRQVVVVSHQRRTKDVGDVVFGVDVTGNGASLLHYRFEPATKRLIVFGRARGNWLERTAALEDKEGGWSGPRSASLPAAGGDDGAGDKTCC
jgi:chromosome segregation protein